ncbi:hypothetical protein BGZ46_009253 [Entomortierella lignicola]|nr:hypothetical protein BGZ46_009253 [Entomortierella lignicola]
MDNVVEYQLVFLNELHDKLKQLDPQRNRIAGLYRIIGRLTDYDLENQIVKVESCFHHQYTPSTVAAYNTLHTTKQYGLESKPVSDSNTIDLTLDEDEDEKVSQNQIKYHNHDHTHNQIQYQDTESSTSNGCVDLTSSTDEEDNATDIQNLSSETKAFIGDDQSSPKHYMPESVELIKQNRKGPSIAKGGRKIILWVDTHLLEPWKYEPEALFQFMGEVAYETGHWILQARACRNMEGLDLYTYRESILLTRELMQRDLERRQRIDNHAKA